MGGGGGLVSYMGYTISLFRVFNRVSSLCKKVYCPRKGSEMNEFCHKHVQGSVLGLGGTPLPKLPLASSSSLGGLDLRFSNEEILFLFLGTPLSCTYTSNIARNAAFIRGLEFFGKTSLNKRLA